MLPDQTAVHSKERRWHSRIRTVSAELYGHCARAVRISRWRSTNPSQPVHAIHHRSSVRPHDSSRTVAPKISKVHVVPEEAES
jgi:hypothetical protein